MKREKELPLCDASLVKENAHDLGADDEAVAHRGWFKEVAVAQELSGKLADALDAATGDRDERGEAEELGVPWDGAEGVDLPDEFREAVEGVDDVRLLHGRFLEEDGQLGDAVSDEGSLGEGLAVVVIGGVVVFLGASAGGCLDCDLLGLEGELWGLGESAWGRAAPDFLISWGKFVEIYGQPSREFLKKKYCMNAA